MPRAVGEAATGGAAVIDATASGAAVSDDAAPWIQLRLVVTIHRRARTIDAGEYDGTKVINEAIAAAGAVQDRIARPPTWPWPPQVFRGFLSALLLPAVVYLISRLIGGQIGV
jgi:hypothetical protein